MKAAKNNIKDHGAYFDGATIEKDVLEKIIAGKIL